MIMILIPIPLGVYRRDSPLYLVGESGTRRIVSDDPTQPAIIECTGTFNYVIIPSSFLLFLWIIIHCPPSLGEGYPAIQIEACRDVAMN